MAEEERPDPPPQAAKIVSPPASGGPATDSGPVTPSQTVPPAPYNVRSADAKPATDYASVTSSQSTAPRGTIIAADANTAGTSATLGVGATADRLELEGGRIGAKGSDSGERLTSAEATRAKTGERPVDEMLNDPLREVTRKERRSLLGLSAIALLIGWTHARVIPSKIANLGIEVTARDHRVLLRLFFAIVVYYTVAFILYAVTDALKYWHTADEVLRKQEREAEDSRPNSMGRSLEARPWWRGIVTPASLARAFFDFGVTVAIAVVAMCALWGAVPAPSAPAAPTAAPATAPAPPAVAPVVPPVIEPTQKTAPVPAKP